MFFAMWEYLGNLADDSVCSEHTLACFIKSNCVEVKILRIDRVTAIVGSGAIKDCSNA